MIAAYIAAGMAWLAVGEALRDELLIHAARDKKTLTSVEMTALRLISYVLWPWVAVYYVARDCFREVTK